MNITPSGLTRVSGLAAAAAGALFIGIQVGHPHLDAASVQTTEMAVRDTLKVVMAAPAFSNGIAMIGLGLSLWLGGRTVPRYALSPSPRPS